MYDVLVLGGGPAALAAAVYLARQKLSFVLIAETIGGQATWSADVENYLGFHLLDGIQLVKRFREHLEDYQSIFALKEGESIRVLEKEEGGFAVQTVSGQTYQGKTALIATGSTHRALRVPGEERLYGHGLTYCATCDAPLYRDKTVCVVGGGNSAMDAALLLEKYAKRVLLVTVNASLQGDAIMRKKIMISSKISVVPLTKVTEILGDSQVTGVKLEEDASHQKQERIELVDGVCIEIGLVPSSQMVAFVAKDKRGQIIVDKANATNVTGVWAAGDVTDIAQKQIAIAVGEGAKAALSIIKHFQTTS